MKILGYIQTKDRRICEWVDFISYPPTENHAQICDEFYPGKYFRIADRSIGGYGVLHIDQIRLFFKIKSKII